MTNGHPLEPLSAEEIATANKLLLADSRMGARPRFAYVTLAEPVKGEPAPERRALAVAVDRADGTTIEAYVSLDRKEVERVTRLRGHHAPILDEEWIEGG